MIYENPEASSTDRKEQWRALEMEYLPHREYEDNDFMENGGYWQGQSHIYQTPFYYIDYTLAQICAFQFWMKSMKDNEAAWIDYLRLCKEGGKKPFLELVKLADLDSPFDENCLKDVASTVKGWLDNFDKSRFVSSQEAVVD